MIAGGLAAGCPGAPSGRAGAETARAGPRTERAAAVDAQTGAAPTGDAPLVVLSYNVRYDNPDDAPNDWASRRDRVASLIAGHAPHAAGLQEALLGQLRDLEARLPAYRWVGVGREDGAEEGEFSPILYRTDRLRLEDAGTFWLSPTPDSAGSVGWDAALPRIATWARFEDRESGRAFLHVNTHFDHRGPEARRESARLLRERAARLAEGVPVIVTGDLNAEPRSPPLQSLLACPEGGGLCLVDTREVASVREGPEGTYPGFAAGDGYGGRIDYVLASRGAEVARHAHASESAGGFYPSDHLPVLAEVRFP